MPKKALVRKLRGREKEVQEGRQREREGGLGGGSRNTWHDVLHLLSLFSLLLSLHALRGSEEQTEGHERHASADPGDHVRPVVLDGGGVLQDLPGKTRRSRGTRGGGATGKNSEDT